MELILEENRTLDEDIQADMESALSEVLTGEGVDGRMGQVSLTLVSGEEIRRLNKEFRQVDQVTDVLSFPQFISKEDIPKDSGYLLGDVVICCRRAKEQAEEYGHSLKRELVYLFVHSIFHLLGYDHMQEEERRRMRAAEEQVMIKVGLERRSDEDN